jgi:pyrroline-5-carboxylate reductase
MRIAIIGIGRLGSVFAKALSKRHELILIDRDFENAKNLAGDIGAQALKDISLAKDCEMIVVAVKPDHVQEVIAQLKEPQLIVSCAAGVPIKKLESWGARNIIRIMPNICAEVEEAVIAYALHPEAEKKEKLFLTAFSPLGLCIKTDESHLDPITAASGSGPAFIAFFAEAMIEEAVANGLHPETAEKAVAQTLVGTGKLILSGWSPKKIRDTVASPGGTTEAGLKMLEDKKTNKAIHEAIRFAANKARELGK